MEPFGNGGESDMENEKRALSWREFVESGFDGREYQFPDFEGTFAATIACKRWDKNRNLLAYLDFDDGRKIMTFATSGGSGIGKTNEKLAPSCKGAKLLEGRVLNSNAGIKELTEWVETLGL